jgi:hypothetical protein
MVPVKRVAMPAALLGSRPSAATLRTLNGIRPPCAPQLLRVCFSKGGGGGHIFQPHSFSRFSVIFPYFSRPRRSRREHSGRPGPSGHP